MIAELLNGRFVALHLDAHTRARDVWVSISGDRGTWPRLTRMDAIRECVQDVAADIDALAGDARRVSQLVDVRERSTAESQQLLDLAEHLDDTLERVHGNVARMLDPPTADDYVDIIREYETAEPDLPDELDALDELDDTTGLAAMYPGAAGLATHLETLAHDALCVHRLVDIRGRDRTATESQRMRTLAHEVADTLDHVRGTLAGLLACVGAEHPTVSDASRRVSAREDRSGACPESRPSHALVCEQQQSESPMDVLTVRKQRADILPGSCVVTIERRASGRFSVAIDRATFTCRDKDTVIGRGNDLDEAVRDARDLLAHTSAHIIDYWVPGLLSMAAYEMEIELEDERETLVQRDRPGT